MNTALNFLILVLFGTVCQAQIYYIQDMTTVEITALDKDKTVVLLPGGILEQHGPYLPSFTDGYKNEALTKEIANAIVKRKGLKVLIFPIIPLGTGGANEIGRKYNFSGTYAIRQKTLRALLMDLSSELGDQGFKTIFVVHLHGAPNHHQAIDQASDFFTDTYKGRMVNIRNLFSEPEAPILNERQQKEDGISIHAGAIEHSILLYLKPEFRKLNYKEAQPETASSPEDLVTLAKKDNWPGYFGSPRLASPAIGEKAWEARTGHIIEQIEKVLDNKYDFSQPTYYQQMTNNPVFKFINEDAKNFDKEKESKQNEWLKSKGLE